MKVLKISLICILSVCLFGAIKAQDTSKKKIVVVEKVTDNDGNVTTKRVVKEGAEAEKYLNEKKKELGVDGKVKHIKKEIKVEERISDSNEKEMVVLKVKDDEGNVKVLKWDGEGEMPEDMKKYMEEEDFQLDEDGLKSEENVWVEKKMKDGQEKEKIVIKVKSEDGEEKVLEWNGEGEMPEEMTQYIEEEDMEMKMEGLEMKKEVRVRMKKNSVDTKNAKKIVIKVKDEDGKEKTMKWEGEGEMPEDMKKYIDEADMDIDVEEDANGQVRVIVKSPDEKPRLGIMLENHVEGVRVINVIEDSAAEKAGLMEGDIIYEIEGVSVGSDLQLKNRLKMIKEGTSAKISFLRNGENQTVSVKL